MLDVIVKPHTDLVDFHNWDEFAEKLNKLAEMDLDVIILDLSNVQRMSSNYIGSVISTFKNLNEKGRELIIVNTMPKLYELFEMLKLTDMIRIEKA